jgi:microcystin-dependent protein
MGDSILASIILFGGNFAPRGFAFCEGQTISISNYTAVFSLVGTTYGGNGTSTFALPDFREAEKSLGGARYIIALEGIFPSRS